MANKKTVLLQNGTIMGYFDTSKDLFEFIRLREGKKITCLCQLAGMGYTYE